MVSTRSSTRTEQAVRRRGQLVAVALELFVERGVENVSVAEVAARAGVANGLVYHYFSTKDELLMAVLDQASPVAAFTAVAESMRGLPAAEGLRVFTLSLGRMLDERGDVLRFLFRESLSPRSVLPPKVATMQEQVLSGLASYLSERIALGELRPHDPRAPFRMLISSALVLGLTKQPVGPWVDSFVDTILGGIRAEEPPP